jgi:hypothetical protein
MRAVGRQDFYKHCTGRLPISIPLDYRYCMSVPVRTLMPSDADERQQTTLWPSAGRTDAYNVGERTSWSP